jgi:hypothetical protein
MPTDGNDTRSEVAGTADVHVMLLRLGMFAVKVCNAFTLYNIRLLDEQGMRAVMATAAKQTATLILSDIRAGRTRAEVERELRTTDNEADALLNSAQAKPPGEAN